MTTLDPVQLALTQKRLDHIARQMGWVMTRTARSPIFNQSHDFSCFIASPDGTLVSQADGIPIHTGGGGFSVRAILKAFAGRIEDGDVFLLNDPYVAGGNHLPDWVIARPVFVEGHLAGFACNRAHQSDIGGGAAGTYNSAATEIFHEGIRLPVLKLIERGTVRDDLWQLLLINSRTPELLDGDLRAMIGSTKIGADRIAALVREAGIETGLALFEGILYHADRRFRAALATLPPGRYEGSDRTDNDCFEKKETVIRVALTLGDSGLHVDFTGTDPQMRGFKNSSLANTYSAVYMALASFFEPDLPRNEGTFRSVRITAPEGTVVNARPPAPMTMCTVFVAHEIVHAVWKALAKADPSRACAGWGKTIHNITSGLNPDGQRFVMYHWNAMMAGGAVPGRDGLNQIGLLIALGGLVVPNVEVYEQLYPTLIRRHEFRTDGGGLGEFRGGTGVEYEADMLVPCDWTFRGEGVGYPTGYGVAGGGFGAEGRMWVHTDDGRTIEAPQYGLAQYGPAKIRALSPGGGGLGDPFAREPERVRRDVRDGVVSPEAAQRDYGVVLRGPKYEIDGAATAALRQQRRSA